MTTVASTRLSDQQVRDFAELGFTVVHDVLPDRLLADVARDITAEIDRLATTALGEGRLTQLYRELDFGERLSTLSRETDEIVNEINGRGTLTGEGIFRLITAPRLLDAIESLVGSEVIASSVYRIRAKLPGARSRIAWHQDSAFFEPFCDDGLIVTAWLPLVDATADNGCLWIWPGEHHNGLRRHVPEFSAGALGLAAEHLPTTQGMPVPVRRGDAILFTNLTPHASFGNSTDRVRWSVDVRYQSATLPTNARISALPGEERSSQAGGAADGVPSACYPPEADLLVRSVSRPDEIVRSAGEFAALRREHEASAVSRQWVSDDGTQVYPPDGLWVSSAS